MARAVRCPARPTCSSRARPSRAFPRDRRDRARRARHGHRRQRPHADARPHRQSLAHDARAPDAGRGHHGDVGYTNLLASVEAAATLMRGFTTVRDMGGPSFGLKRAIDEGLVIGPRIYPSGAMITITGGHGDFRQPFELPRVIGGPLTRGGADRRKRDRRQPRRGAGPRARAAAAGRVADQAHGRRRRGVAAQSARRLDIHRSGIARRGGGRGKLGHLRRRPRVYAGRDPAGDRRGRQGHRARPPDGRTDGEADGRKGHLALLPAVHG